MVPAFVIVLSELPLTANGKLDRAALPMPGVLVWAGDEAPATPTEELLAGLWCAVLGVERVGREGDFFALGGHSLLATRLVSRIRDSFAVELGLSVLFERPVLRDLALAIEGARHQELDESRIVKVRRDVPLPLSFAQERLWFLAQLEPENPFYNTPFAFRLIGSLDREALRAAMASLVERHEVLRTAFLNEAGRPCQEIRPALKIPLTEVDLSHLPPDEREAGLFAHVAAEAKAPFADLGRPPLMRIKLVQLGRTEHALLLTLHHIVTDGWSLDVLLREIAHVYNAHRRGERPSLPPLSIQYADFATWQRALLGTAVFERQFAYWYQKLANAPPTLSLPTDHPRPAVQRFRGATLRFTIDRTTRDRLYRLGRAQNATLFMTLLAAFATLLYRYSSQADIVIGSPIANRRRTELEPLLGFFVNTLAFRIDLGGEPSFIGLVERVRRIAVEGYANQDIPFERLIGELQPERDLSRNPLFQVMFTLQNMPLRHNPISDLTIEAIRVEREAALFDLMLDFWDTPDGLAGSLEYNSDLFETETARRMMAHLDSLLRRFADAPAASIGSVSLLDETETNDLLTFSNGSDIAYPVGQSLALVFEEQVQATPERMAAVADGATCCYEELNRRANRVAHLLRAIGVEAGNPVGVLITRGLDYLAAMLGSIKAGGAFLPLDPAYPAERRRYMLEDSGVEVLLTTEAHLSSLTPGEVLSLQHVVLLAGSAAGAASPGPEIHAPTMLARQPDYNPPLANNPRDPLYILYTSGSTGLPKGTVVRHDGALNHIFAEARLLECAADLTFLQSAPASSDISIWQCLAPVLLGGRVVFADLDTVCAPRALFDLIVRERVTLIELVPVVLDGLIDHAARLTLDERASHCLHRVMVTGEAASIAVVDRYFTVFADIPLVNAYGPTEAADDVCQHLMRGPLPKDATTVPIGVPVDNLSVLILDRHQGLVPVGVPGEICVSGIGVGPGYWRQPERTASAFVPNPYLGKTFGDTLYRTGDLGRWRADGCLEFLGRLDDQVKIRGFRVELGEVEAALSRHPQVRDAVVIDHFDAHGELQLAAYLQARTGREQIDALIQDQVSLWKELHERSYGEADARDPTFNTVGWDSTYTGEPLSAAEMHECVVNAVERILALRPQNLFEIGCGTGLLLYRLAPHCVRYWGTDLSTTAIQQLEAARKLPGIERTTLLAQPADEYAGLPPEGIDTVVLNSVVQYFPNLDYLLRVLRGAIARCTQRGAIFLGDVRDERLLRSYHASVQLFRAEDGLSCAALNARISSQVAREQELTVAPELFHRLPGEVPRVSAVVVRPKRGLIHNEMTRFRYDAVLLLGTMDPMPLCPEDAWRCWSDQPMSFEALCEHLRSFEPTYWGLRRVANARLTHERCILAFLAEASAAATVHDLRAALAAQPEYGIDPEALWRLEDELPYRVDIQIEASDEGDSFAVLFSHRDSPQVRIDHMLLSSTKTRSDRASWSNNPLQEALARQLFPSLHEFLKEILPRHMIPASFNLLDRFPLMPNGKIDRRALPPPALRASRVSAGGTPRTLTERFVRSVWAEVLDVEDPGIHDNFFELGGHSLKATQVVSRLQQRYRKRLTLRHIFNQPTIAELAAKLDLEDVETVGTAIIPVTPKAAHYSVSRAQQRLWVLSQIGGAAAYHMAGALRLRGAVEASALEQGFRQLLERHEILRTCFVEIDGSLRQVVVDQVRPAFDIVDVCDRPTPAASVPEAALQYARESFDLSAAPLFRSRLLRLSAEEHVLLFNMHHIISDGWSFDVLVRELIVFYAAAMQGREPELVPLRVQYRDYVAWQQARLAEGGAALRAYWVQQLADLPPFDLPTDFPRPPVKTYNGGREHLVVAPAVQIALAQFAQTREVSLFMLLIALVKVLLHRYSGAVDISVGCPIAGRNAPELENQIGFYVNTLVLRDSLEVTEPFDSFLARVRETLVAAYDHQEYPFDQLVQDLNPSRDPSRNPLFDVMVALQNNANLELELPGVTIEPLSIDFGTAQFDMLWNFAEARDGLHVTLHYNSDLFCADTIASLLRCWHTLTQGAIVDPAQAVGRLPLLTEKERTELLVIAPPPKGLTPPFRNLVDWFEAQALAEPIAIAVTDGKRNISYAELNFRANQLARALRKRLEPVGGALGKTIGLCIPRSAETIIGILGILKAGAAYVPIDPEAPERRIRFILEDALVPLLVTQHGCLDILSEHLPPQQFIDIMPPVGEDNQSVSVGPDSPAYVIYTSGSSGEPKGAVITHGNVVRLLNTTERWFAFGPKDVWTQFHSYAFDFSVWEIWGALLYGGRLVMVPYVVSRSPDLFYELLSRERVTVLNQTPSAFRQLIEAEQERLSELPLTLRTVILGGETLEPAMLRSWFERHGESAPRLVNMYGITETTVHVTYRPLTAEDTHSTSSPIGAPIPDLHLDIFDEYFEPVPPGIPGELYVSGAGLAQGYFRREALTRDRFITDPHGRGGRLYRSGDRVRRRPDGEIEYLGRLDDQVKIRGFRVETGEVAATLVRHGGVADAAVTLHERNGNAFLVAHYVPREGAVETADLRRHLQDLLPAYMIPAYFIALPRLPLTVNGKLDRRALPSPEDLTRATPRDPQREPTSIEQQVLACWRLALGEDRLRADDNVFDYGANSVLAVQVRGMLQSALKREIPVVLLFQHLTPSTLAAALQGEILVTDGHRKSAATWRAQQRRAAASRPRSSVSRAHSL
jgi:amino acid adenylation domain-containing protein